MFDRHMLVWFISGKTRIIQADSIHTFGKGDIFLIPRNQLATIINYPADSMPHQTVVMHLTKDLLRYYYETAPPKYIVPVKDKIRSFSNHPLLESCLQSLIPYFDLDILPDNLAALKITEAITILRSIDPAIDGFLANFETPEKIDLEDFMERNFMFNLTLDKFSYLTGRSLTAFRKDFKTIFGLTPQRWLTRKRPDLAHYQLVQQKRRPVDICYDVGFENLSHFSFAFKKFGYPPTALL